VSLRSAHFVSCIERFTQYRTERARSRENVYIKTIINYKITHIHICDALAVHRFVAAFVVRLRMQLLFYKSQFAVLLFFFSRAATMTLAGSSFLAFKELRHIWSAISYTQTDRLEPLFRLLAIASCWTQMRNIERMRMRVRCKSEIVWLISRVHRNGSQIYEPEKCLARASATETDYSL